MEVAVVRTRMGPAAAALGLAGLAAAWWTRDSPDASGILAALASVVLAAGLLVAARAGGEAPTRITGGLLCLAGLAVVITQHQVWWWLPTGWETPLTIAWLVIAAAGFGTLLFAYGFRMAGLSGACGVLAAVCLSATALPYLGSEDKAVLRALTAALGAVALVAGLRAAARPAMLRSRGWRGALAGAAALAVGFTGYDAYGTYAPIGYRLATIAATLAGIATVLLLGAWSRWPAPPGRSPATGPLATPSRPPPSAGPRASAVPAPVSPSAPAAAPAGTAVPVAAPTLRARLETLSLAVGVVIGLITILKEVVAAFRALLG
jgi:hypothetical protein